MNVKQILPVAVMAIATLTGCEGKKEMNAGIYLKKVLEGRRPFFDK